MFSTRNGAYLASLPRRMHRYEHNDFNWLVNMQLDHVRCNAYKEKEERFMARIFLADIIKTAAQQNNLSERQQVFECTYSLRETGLLFPYTEGKLAFLLAELYSKKLEGLRRLSDTLGILNSSQDEEKIIETMSDSIGIQITIGASKWQEFQLEPSGQYLADCHQSIIDLIFKPKLKQSHIIDPLTCYRLQQCADENALNGNKVNIDKQIFDWLYEADTPSFDEIDFFTSNDINSVNSSNYTVSEIASIFRYSDNQELPLSKRYISSQLKKNPEIYDKDLPTMQKRGKAFPKLPISKITNH